MKKINKCPVCHKVINESIWSHAKRQNHKDFILEQLRICNELFFNTNYTGQEIENFYINYYQVKCLWKKWFGKEEYEKRKKLRTKTFNEKQKINWKELFEQSYYNKFLYFDHTCPICYEIGFNKARKIDVIAHIKKHCKDPKHFDLLCQVIGDVLHREYWDKTCFYSKNAFYEILKQVKGKEYAINVQNKHRNTSQNGASGFRPDLGFNVNSSWEANIYRIIKYETKQNLNWKRGVDYEIPFDISTKNHKQTYYVDFYDRYGIFKKDAFIEIKGRYGKNAKRKRALFKKLYPNLNYIMIGIPYGDFHPNINYLDLYEKYQDIIPHWEKFSDKKKNRNIFKERKDIKGKRKDLGVFTNSIYEANLLRIFKYEYGKKWKDFIEFDTKFDIVPYEEDIDNVYIARFCDKGNLFGPNAYIEIHKDIYASVRNQISYVRESFPNIKIITIGSEAFDNFLYFDLENKYKTLIPLWETEEHNLETDRVTYDAMYRKRTKPKNDPQRLGRIFIEDKIKSYYKELDFIYQAKPGQYDFAYYNLDNNICPFCKEVLNYAFIQHICNKYETHIDFIEDQAKLIADLFWDVSYHSNNDNHRYNLFFSAKACREFWSKLFPYDLYQQRITLGRKKNPRSEKEFHDYPHIKINNSGNQGNNMKLDYDWYIEHAKKMSNIPEEYKTMHTNDLIRHKDEYEDYLLDQVYVAIQLFNDLSYNALNPIHKDMSRNFKWVENIWEKKFGKDKVEERQKNVNNLK